MKKNNEEENWKIEKERNIIYTLEKAIKFHKICAKSNSKE